MTPLTDEECEPYLNQRNCVICKKTFEDTDNKSHRKVRDHCHYTGQCRGTTYGVNNLRYKIPDKSPTVLHSGSNYEHDFIVKALVDIMTCMYNMTHYS